MGTRSLICVVKDGEYRVAQYCHWDGYPEGQGIGVLAFLKSANLEKFKEKLDKVSWITHDELEKQWVETGAEPDAKLVSSEVAEKFKNLYPENSRDTGAKILQIIYEAEKPLKLVNSLDFAANSLFCEWAYVVDLDNNKLEVYEGFNEEPLVKGERFYFLQESLEEDSGYYPVKLVASFDINNLPDEVGFIEIIKENCKGSSFFLSKNIQF